MKKTFLLVCAFAIYAGTVLAQYPAISFFDGTQVTEDVEALKNGTNPFQKFTATIEAVDGTATVTFAHGTLPKIHATNDTTITFDNTDYPTNGVNRVRIAVFAYTNAIGFDSTVINTNDFAPTIATNTPDSVTDLYFTRTTTNLWNGRY